MLKGSFKVPSVKRGVGRVVRRERLRLALPSSLVGLVAFSFVVLGLGTAAYTASLPTLVSTSPVVAQVKDAVEQSQDQAAQRSDVREQAQDGSAGGGSAATSAASSLPHASLSAAAPVAASPEASTADDANADSADTPADTPAAPDAPEEEPGTEDPSDPSVEPGADSTKPSGSLPDEREQEIYAYLSGQIGEVQVAYGEVQQLNAQMSSSFLAGDLSQRTECYRRAEAVCGSIWNMRADALNHDATFNGSRYKSSSEALVGMYRCLYDAAGSLDAAWEQNIAYADAAENQDALRGLYDEAMSSEQSHLDEYNKYAGQFAL